MAMPPVFSKSFYKLLTEAAEEFGISRSEFVMRALRYYIKELRIRKSPITEALDEESAKTFSQIQSKLSRNYWATLTEDERKARTAAAREGRWPKKKEVNLTVPSKTLGSAQAKRSRPRK
jgi:hypothetical protein